MKSFYKHIHFFIYLVYFLTHTYNINAQEICNNGKDDDNDGLIDLNDPDCQCHFSVTDNLLLNGSFENYNHCPVSYTYDKDYNIADGWQYGTYTNTNEADFYHNFNCSYDSGLIMLHSPGVVPLPQGSAFISIQNDIFTTPLPETSDPKGYVGQCLQAPLKKNENYTLSFYAGRFKSWDDPVGKIFPFTVALFGNADCAAAPFGKVNAFGNGCPADYNGWVFLGKATVYGGQWIQDKISFTAPFDINLIEVGPDCSALKPLFDLPDNTTYLDYHVYYLDDMHLLPTKDFPFEYVHTQTGNNCSVAGLPVLEAPVFSNSVYQWYKDSIAIAGATQDVFNVKDTSGASFYNVRITTTGKCIISEPFLITGSKLNQVNIPADTVLCSLDKSITLSPALTGITYSVNGISSTEAVVTTAGNYQVIASDIYGCQKIFTANVSSRNCSDCAMEIPNAFTPNGDGLNDVFKPKPDCISTEFHIRIFNRWGEKIFESRNMNNAWNGYSYGKKLTGTYVYFIDYKNGAGFKKTVKGIVVLLL